MTPLWKLDIPRDVQIVKWGLAALTAVFGLAFWFLLGQIGNRFDRADEKISALSDKVSDVRVSVAGQSADVKAILEKLDAKPETSSSAKPDQAVHNSTRRSVAVN